MYLRHLFLLPSGNKIIHIFVSISRYIQIILINGDEVDNSLLGYVFYEVKAVSQNYNTTSISHSFSVCKPHK